MITDENALGIVHADAITVGECLRFQLDLHGSSCLWAAVGSGTEIDGLRGRLLNLHGHQRRLALARGSGDQFTAPVLTAPDKQLVRVYAVAPRDHGDGDAGLERLEDNPQLLFQWPSAACPRALGSLINHTSPATRAHLVPKWALT